MSPTATFQNGATANGIHTNGVTTNGNGVHVNGVTTNGVLPDPSTLKKHIDGFATRAIHVGSEPNAETGAVIPPISLSTTYEQEAIGVHKGYEYSRSGNPNRNLLERTLASLESSHSPSGNVALAFSSGSSTTSAVLSSLGPNAHIVSVNDVYGGTFRYISRVASTLQGLQSTFLDLENAADDEILGALRENTKLVWIESPTNPTLRVVDVPRIAALVERGWREGKTTERPIVLVDNTFLSPYYASPLLQGADVVLHSLTKYVNGHSDVVMGALILPASTPDAPSNQPGLQEKLRFLQNAMGAVPSPFDCFLAQRGAKTLALRMKTHGLNALAVARALQSLADEGAGVDEVVYPGLPGRTPESRRKHVVAWRMLSPHARRWISEAVYPGRGLEASDEPPAEGFPFSGMISVRLSTPPSLSPNSTGTAQFQTANAFLTALRLFTLAESLGGVESLAEHPAAMTHGSIPPAEREVLGIGENLVRLSVGVEEEADLVRDVRGAVGRSWGVAGAVEVKVKVEVKEEVKVDVDVEEKARAAPIACGRDGMCREFEY